MVLRAGTQLPRAQWFTMVVALHLKYRNYVPAYDPFDGVLLCFCLVASLPLAIKTVEDALTDTLRVHFSVVCWLSFGCEPTRS